jgi:hypothetical protein
MRKVDALTIDKIRVALGWIEAFHNITHLDCTAQQLAGIVGYLTPILSTHREMLELYRKHLDAEGPFEYCIIKSRERDIADSDRETLTDFLNLVSPGWSTT